jgi:hypothetical protein
MNSESAFLHCVLAENIFVILRFGIFLFAKNFENTLQFVF